MRGVRTPSHGRAALGGLLAATLALGGCAEGGYYAHSLYGGAKVLAKRQKIARLLEDPALDPALRERLTAAVEIRDFASRELGLPDNKSYRTYVDIGREAVSWTVTAAPEFSIAPVTWCFPVAGCVSYKGYFAPEKAAHSRIRCAPTATTSPRAECRRTRRSAGSPTRSSRPSSPGRRSISRV